MDDFSFRDIFPGAIPWWGYVIGAICVYVGHQMAHFYMDAIIKNLHGELADKKRHLAERDRWIGELTSTLDTTGRLKYGVDEIKHGQKFWKVEQVKERVVYEHNGKWGLFLIHNKDEDGIPTKTEISSLGWVDKQTLLEFLQGRLYRLEREDDHIEAFKDEEGLDSTPTEQLQEQFASIGMVYKSDEGKSALS